MMHGRNNGKKLMAIRIVKHAFEIIHLLTGEVSQVFCMLQWYNYVFHCARTHCRYWLMLLSTADLGKIPHVLAELVQLGDKLLMCLHCEE